MAKVDKQQLWTRRIAAGERSGLSRRAWCAAQGLNTHTYDYWRRRLRGAPARQASKERRQALVPIRVRAKRGERSLSPSAMIELALPHGVVLRASSAVDARWLGTLVREVSAC
jgi:hypothetical protein